MNNASDYITGDDMIALLIAEGGDEAPTYDPADKSIPALVARNAETFIRPGMARDAVIGYYDISIGDHDPLERHGFIRLNHAAPGQSFLCTDLGAVLAASLHA
jgi:hypothetical protein